MTFYIYFLIIACSFLEYSYISPKLWGKCVKCTNHESAFLHSCEVVKREQQLWGLRIVDKTQAAEKKAPPHTGGKQIGDTC